MLGTWLHPHLAIDVARWCSPRFGVAVSKFVFEQMRKEMLAPAPLTQENQATIDREIDGLNNDLSSMNIGQPSEEEKDRMRLNALEVSKARNKMVDVTSEASGQALRRKQLLENTYVISFIAFDNIVSINNSAISMVQPKRSRKQQGWMRKFLWQNTTVPNN